MAIQALCYTAIAPESAESMGAKLHAAPDSCFVVLHAGQIAGYLLALPWRFDAPPTLDQPDSPLPDTPDTLYLHDLAIAPDARGSGAAQRLVSAFLTRLNASSLPRASLIAIQDSGSWWARHGFLPVPPDQALASRLRGYGDTAMYMWRPTDSTAPD